jgi:hypothetical protein
MKPFFDKYLFNSISVIVFLSLHYLAFAIPSSPAATRDWPRLTNMGRQDCRAAKTEFKPFYSIWTRSFFISKMLDVIEVANSNAILRFSSDALGRTMTKFFSFFSYADPDTAGVPGHALGCMHSCSLLPIGRRGGNAATVTGPASRRGAWRLQWFTSSVSSNQRKQVQKMYNNWNKKQIFLSVRTFL